MEAGFLSFHWLYPAASLALMIAGILGIKSNSALVKGAQVAQAVSQAIDSGQKSPDAK